MEEPPQTLTRVPEAPAPAGTGRPPLDIAVAGTRGVPARYGGFETCAEELGRRLVQRGHRVTVYGRTRYVGSDRRTHLGIQVVPVVTVPGKYFETPLHTLFSALVAVRARHDVVLLCNAANAFTIPLFRLGGAKVAINVDGVDRLRRKWGPLGRLGFLLGERLSVALAHRTLADAQVIFHYYLDRYGHSLDVIPYGGDRTPPHPTAVERVLKRFGLQGQRFVLVVGRLEPENNALLVVQAFRRVRAEVSLVVVGDAPYAASYKARLKGAAGPRVVFTGGVYGDDYLALQAGAACYVAAGEVGGTHPSLVEAMSVGPPIVANDVPEHREVLGEAGLYYSQGDERALAAAVDQVLADDDLGARLKRSAREKATSTYRWDQVVDRYEDLFHSMLAGAARK